jgi:hypothetical protein
MEAEAGIEGQSAFERPAVGSDDHEPRDQALQRRLAADDVRGNANLTGVHA